MSFVFIQYFDFLFSTNTEIKWQTTYKVAFEFQFYSFFLLLSKLIKQNKKKF